MFITRYTDQALYCRLLGIPIRRFLAVVRHTGRALMRKCPPHALIRRGMAFWGPGSTREVQAAGPELHFHGTRSGVGT